MLQYAAYTAVKSRASWIGLDKACVYWNLGCSVAAATLMLTSLWHHEPWSDEIHAWGLAVASPTPLAIFHNLAYDGHPGLWHLLLWCASCISTAPVMLKVVHGAIGLGIIAMLGLYLPAGRAERVLLLLNYFVLFEFTVISRNYGIGLLLSLIYCTVYIRRREAFGIHAVILALLANTNVFGLILSVILLTERVGRPLLANELRLRRLTPGLLAYGSALALSVATLLPAPDIAFTADRRFLTIANILEAEHAWLALLRFTVTPFMPIASGFPEGFASAGRYWSNAQRLSASAAVLPVLGAIAYLFRKEPWRLFIVFSTIAGGGLFAHLFYLGSIRHCGIVMIAFLVALWLSRASPADKGSGVGHSWIVALLLVGGAVGGAEATAAGWLRTFSNVGPAARWIEAHHLQGMPLIGFWDMQASSVAILLQRPVYLLQCECVVRYAHLDNRRDRFVLTEMPERELLEAFRVVGPGPAILISGIPMPPAAIAALQDVGVRTDALAEFRNAERDREIFLYKLHYDVVAELVVRQKLKVGPNQSAPAK